MRSPPGHVIVYGAHGGADLPADRLAADQLGLNSSRPERDEWAEHRILHRAAAGDDRIEQRSLATLMGEKGVPGDDLRLLKYPEELWQQDCQGRHGDDDERHEVAYPAQHRTPERLEQPPGDRERDDHHAAGEVNGEHPDQREHCQRDPVPVAK